LNIPDNVGNQSALKDSQIMKIYSKEI